MAEAFGFIISPRSQLEIPAAQLNVCKGDVSRQIEEDK